MSRIQGNREQYNVCVNILEVRYRIRSFVSTVEPLYNDTPEMRTAPSIRILTMHSPSYTERHTKLPQ